MPTICPIALTAGCSKCLIVKVCLVKGLVGDYGRAASQPSHVDSEVDDDPLTERRPNEPEPTCSGPDEDDDPLWRP